MSFHHRISTIYRKELTDILRDRRTLIAMIVVPIVLYPLLMLGSIQAISYQVGALEDEQFVVGVVGPEQRDFLERLIEHDRDELERAAPVPDAAPAGDDEEPASRPLHDFTVVTFDSVDAVKDAVRRRAIHLGVVIDPQHLPRSPAEQVTVEFFPDTEDVRSSSAMTRFHGMIARTADRLSEWELARHGLPKQLLEPFIVEVTNLAAPTSVLGQILPLILILMTITGAIYPAIDVTAGERERGTLETLMVCPVRVIDLIVGKFLVVTTVAIMGAALNLVSVSATVYFGGYDVLVAEPGAGVPFGKLAFILLCLIPFAVLMSAIMIAVCSYARTFKEAQNYVTPIILAVLIPGGIAALPATRLEGIMLVMPVGNMVLLARDFLLGANVPLGAGAIVLLSTALYAGAAVAVAANTFGRESVVFADAASIKSSFSRRLIKPADRPTISMALLLVSLLFPLWFFVQAALSPEPGEDARRLLYASGLLMPVGFVLLPVAVLWYWKVDFAGAFALRVTNIWHFVAGALIGLSAWVPAHELSVLQERVVGLPPGAVEHAEKLADALAALPLPHALLLIAVIPAICEELLFRGVLLGGVGSVLRKWTAIVVAAVIFGIFHFMLFRFPVTALLGIVLGGLCWNARSILPGMIAHGVHNAVGVLTVVRSAWLERIGINVADGAAPGHLPVHILLIGGLTFLSGLLLAFRPAEPSRTPSLSAAADSRASA